jgi:hypothetical protein
MNATNPPVKTKSTSHIALDQIGILTTKAQSKIIPNQSTMPPIEKNAQISAKGARMKSGQVPIALARSKPLSEARTQMAAIAAKV